MSNETILPENEEDYIDACLNFTWFQFAFLPIFALYQFNSYLSIWYTIILENEK